MYVAGEGGGIGKQAIKFLFYNRLTGSVLCFVIFFACVFLLF